MKEEYRVALVRFGAVSVPACKAGGCLTPPLEGLPSLVWQGVSSLLEIHTDSCLISSAHLATPVRPQ